MSGGSPEESLMCSLEKVNQQDLTVSPIGAGQLYMIGLYQHAQLRDAVNSKIS